MESKEKSQPKPLQKKSCFTQMTRSFYKQMTLFAPMIFSLMKSNDFSLMATSNSNPMAKTAQFTAALQTSSRFLQQKQSLFFQVLPVKKYSFGIKIKIQ